jgi:hypothetical protein
VGQFTFQLLEVGQLCVSGEQPTICSSYVIPSVMLFLVFNKLGHE